MKITGYDEERALLRLEASQNRMAFLNALLDAGKKIDQIRAGVFDEDIAEVESLLPKLATGNDNDRIRFCLDTEDLWQFIGICQTLIPEPTQNFEGRADELRAFVAECRCLAQHGLKIEKMADEKPGDLRH